MTATDRTEATSLTLCIGDVRASADGVVLHTLVGSCIAVCLFDDVARVGGMNHFALPSAADGRDGTSTRFGDRAIDDLLHAMGALGARRERLVAKIFGGARILSIGAPEGDVPSSNVDFARAALAEARIAIVASDVGGRDARRIRFHTDTGRAFVTRLRRHG